MRIGILLLLMWGISMHVQAQEVQKITLQEAIDIALENSIELQQSENNLKFAEAAELNSRLNFLPSLNGTFNGNYGVGRTFNESNLTFENISSSRLSGSIDANMPLFEGFSNILNLRSSRANRDLEENSLERTRETVIFNAASGFLQVLLNQQLLDIAQENLEASQQQLKQVEAQVDVGSRPTVDLYNQESEVANNELEVIDQENTLEISETQLIRILQLDPLEEYEFTMPPLSADDASQTEYDLAALTEEALANRKDLRSQELNIDILKNTMRESRNALYPSITANASLGSGYQDYYTSPDPETGELQSVDFRNQFFDQQISRSVGFSINIPIFNNWSQRLNIQRNQIDYKNAQLDLEDERYAVREEVRQAYNDYRSYVKRLEASQTALRAAERTYETQQQRYEVGSSTLIELTDANARYFEAQSNQATALYNLVFQERLLDYYLGNMDQDITFQ